VPSLRTIARPLYRPARTIPALPWRASGSQWSRPRLTTLLVLLLGLWLFGTGEAVLVDVKLGNTPWTVLAQGVADRTALDIGAATIVISVLVLVAWVPLRQRPGIGTIGNVVVIGVALDVMSRVLPTASAVGWRALEALGAIALVGIGSALYLTANLGPGPRDGWMTGLHRRFGWPLASIRVSIELAVLGVGIALGGRAGIATIAYALLVGYGLALSLQVLAHLWPADAESG
jgi:uncharacterized membrane protein YczE